MTTNTKELLQLAASAAGKLYDPTRHITKEGVWVVREGAKYQEDMVLWNPATNSGDSRDLQVRLKISLETSGTGWIASKYDGAGRTLGFVGPDPNMAVLIVASKLGKQMKEENENDTQ